MITDIKDANGQSLKTTTDVNWDSATNEIFWNSVDTTLIGSHTFSFEIYFSANTVTPVATKIGIVEFV